MISVLEEYRSCGNTARPGKINQLIRLLIIKPFYFILMSVSTTWSPVCVFFIVFAVDFAVVRRIKDTIRAVPDKSCGRETLGMERNLHSVCHPHIQVSLLHLHNNEVL